MQKLNLGCGKDVREGWVNLDIVKGDGVDIIHDLNQLPLPFEDNSFDLVLCIDILEHINYLPLITDIHRILKKGGILKINVPHFTTKLNFDDPTHIHRFSTRTFNYFVKNKFFNYYRDVDLYSSIKCQITFEKFDNFYLKKINKFLEKWVNKSNHNQYIYESSFLRLFPARNIEILLKKR